LVTYSPVLVSGVLVIIVVMERGLVGLSSPIAQHMVKSFPSPHFSVILVVVVEVTWLELGQPAVLIFILSFLMKN
jgi:hypothetical protein